MDYLIHLNGFLDDMWNFLIYFSEPSKTVLIGVAVYVLGQLISKLFIEPIHQLRLTIGEVGDTLAFYANVYTNPGTLPKRLMDEASSALRQKAMLLRSKVSVVNWYAFASLIRHP